MFEGIANMFSGKGAGMEGMLLSMFLTEEKLSDLQKIFEDARAKGVEIQFRAMQETEGSPVKILLCGSIRPGFWRTIGTLEINKDLTIQKINEFKTLFRDE